MQIQTDQHDENTSVLQGALVLFLKQNPELDINTSDLLNKRATDIFSWKNITSEQKEQIILQLKKYQRLLRIVDDMAVVEKLLEAGFHSAYQIAALSEAIFLERFGELFADKEQAQQAYRKALHRRTQVMLHHISKKESHSPYVKASRFFQS